MRLAALAAVLTLAACSKSEPRTDTTPPRDPARPAAQAPEIQLAAPAGTAPSAAAPAADQGATGGAAAGNDQSYKLTSEQPAPAAVGADTVGRLVVHPGAGYKMNKDFPTKLTLEPPAGVTLARTVFEPVDAEHFSEKELAFAVKMSAPAAGEFTIPGTLKFAVCTETTCDPKKTKVALVLKAN